MATYWENSCSFGLRNVFMLVSLGFSHLGFWSGNLFLIAPFPDLCLLVPFYFSEAVRRMKLKLCIHAYDISLYKVCVFYCPCPTTLVAMAT